MTKKMTLIFMIFMMMTLSSCGSTVKEETESLNQEITEHVETIEQTIENQIGAYDLKIYFPVEYINSDGSATEDFVERFCANNKLIEGYSVDENGGVTMYLTRENHEKMVTIIKDNIIQSLEDYIKNDEHKIIKNIEYNSDFTDFKIYMDAFELNGGSMLDETLMCMFSQMYHAFNGTLGTPCTVEFIDPEGNEIGW